MTINIDPDVILTISCRCNSHRAASLQFCFRWDDRSIKGEHMQFSLMVGQTIPFTVAPLDVNGNPSAATLSNLAFSSSDTTLFTVAPDPNTANGGIVTAVAAGTATLTATATATEPDGVTTEQIQGVATGVVTTTPPPPPPVAASLGFTFGTAA